MLDEAGRALLPDAVIGAGIVNQAQLDGQPIGITRPVRSAGKMVCGFGSGIWTTAGNLTLTQGYTGFDANGDITGIRSRTGQAEMLRVVCNDNAATDITMNSPATNILTTILNGRFCLKVWAENIPGYGPAGSQTGSLSVTLTTDAGGSFANGLLVGFNPNQLREGWNYLTFVMRDFLAYQAASGVTEDHPLGLQASSYGTGVAANVKATAITRIKISPQNLSGATLIFDSVWTGFDCQAQLVLGCDAAGSDLLTHALPIFQQYGWKGYIAVPGRIWTSGSKLMSDWTNPAANARLMYEAGWECINHGANHVRAGDLTNPAEIDYEISAVQSMYVNAKMVRGCEFYASPQSSSSRLSDKVIAQRGIKLQRHARRCNVAVTPFGIDNPQHIGAIDMGNAGTTSISSTVSNVVVTVTGWQVFSKLKRFIDMLEAYGATGFPFWHGITTLGDSGSGENTTGDNLLLTLSAFTKTAEYIKQREDAGGIRVRDGMTGFYYGVGR